MVWGLQQLSVQVHTPPLTPHTHLAAQWQLATQLQAQLQAQASQQVEAMDMQPCGDELARVSNLG
jgi:hypothetical protein